jgi:type IV pilus assembly protein PilM
MLPFKTTNLIGIDIGSCSLKVVKLKGRAGSYTLESAGCVKIPEDVGQGPPLAGFLAEMIRSQKMRGREAASIITGPALISRHMFLPMMPDKDLKEAVSWDIRKEIAIPAGNLVTDYLNAATAAGAEQNKLSVIAFSIVKDEVTRIIRLFKDAGLELKVIDVVPSTLLAVFDLNNEWEAGVNYAMLDMGDTSSTLAILKDGRLAFTREIAFGGVELTRSLTATLNITVEEAEQYKIAHGLSVPEDDREKVGEALTSLIERLCLELSRSIDYYQAQFRGGAQAKIFLSGGTASLKGIEDYISDTLGVACFVHDPLKNVTIPGHIDSQALKSISPALNVAVGLSMRTR